MYAAVHDELIKSVHRTADSVLDGMYAYHATGFRCQVTAVWLHSIIGMDSKEQGIRCQAEDCNHVVFRRIHVVNINGQFRLYGSTCSNHKKPPFGAVLGCGLCFGLLEFLRIL